MLNMTGPVLIILFLTACLLFSYTTQKQPKKKELQYLETWSDGGASCAVDFLNSELPDAFVIDKKEEAFVNQMFDEWLKEVKAVSEKSKGLCVPFAFNKNYHKDHKTWFAASIYTFIYSGWNKDRDMMVVSPKKIKITDEAGNTRNMARCYFTEKGTAALKAMLGTSLYLDANNLTVSRGSYTADGLAKVLEDGYVDVEA